MQGTRKRRYYSPDTKAKAVKLFKNNVSKELICETLDIKNVNSLDSILRNEGALLNNSYSEEPVASHRAMVHVPKYRRRMWVRVEVVGFEDDKMSTITGKIEFHKDVTVVDGPNDVKKVVRKKV